MSVNASNESPQSSRSPSSTRPSSPNNEPSAQLLAALHLAEEPNPPVSPGTATRILQHASGVVATNENLTIEEAAELLRSQQDVNDMVRATAFGLVSTIHKREQENREQLDRANLNTRLLARRLAEREAEIIRLEQQLADPVKPDGFRENEGNVRYPIPCPNGAKVVPRWIRRVGGGEVEMLAGLTTGEQVYVAPLFMEPDYTDAEPVSGMDLWFVDLLHGPEGGFHTLAEAARALPEWGAYSEVIRYRRLEEERREYKGELEEISARIRSLQERQDASKHRMEAGRLPQKLANLEGRNNYPRRNPRRGQLAIRGTRRHRAVLAGPGVPA